MRKRLSHRRLLSPVVVAVCAAMLVSCSDEPTPEPPVAAGDVEHEPSPIPEPTEPALDPVAGIASTSRLSVSNGPVVFTPGDPNNRPPPDDEEEIARLVGATVDWLDAHLTDLQAGGEGLIHEVAADGLLERRHGEAWRAVTTALSAPDRLVDHAAYDVLVGVDGAPQWLRVTVRTTSKDGNEATAELVFVPAEGRPVLIAGGASTVDAG
jgi:hypothetical protein